MALHSHRAGLGRSFSRSSVRARLCAAAARVRRTTHGDLGVARGAGGRSAVNLRGQGLPFRKADAVRTKEVPSRSSLEPNQIPPRRGVPANGRSSYLVGTTTTRAVRRGSNERRDTSADRTSVKEVRRTSERPGDRTRPTGFVRPIASVQRVRSQPTNGDGGWPSRDVLGPGHLRG